MRFSFPLVGVALVIATGCVDERVPPGQARAIADTITRLVERAYDLSAPGAVERLMSLYPAEGPIASASDGRIVTSRDTLRESIEAFWNEIGRNMQGPRWVWEQREIEVLSPTSAVMTAVYSIPHHAPSGRPHVVGGAWTAVFAKRDGSWRIVHEHLSSNLGQAMGRMTADSAADPAARMRVDTTR
jgi:ketosteroid isomerase-like protein